jgi:outer membrane immunogenic protein
MTWEFKMRNLFLASLAGLALASGSVFAADLPPAAPMYKAPPMVAAVYNWTGCYLDGGGGYALYNQDHYGETNPGLVATTTSSTSGGRGWYGQGGGGCDYQFSLGSMGNFVVGVLADYDFMSVKGNFESSAGVIVAPEKQSNAWVAGGRIGYLITPQFLTYFSGGYTASKFSGMSFVNGGGAAFLPSHTYNGWFLGGGSEMSLSSWLPTGFFLRNEYRYSSFKAADLPYTGALAGQGENSKKYEQMLGTSLVYRFNFTGH